MSRQNARSVARGLGNLRVAVLAELAQLRLELLVADTRQNGKDHRQILPSAQGLLEEPLGALAGLHEEHPGNGPPPIS